MMNPFLQELSEWRDKYKAQAKELKEAVNKQKIAMEQFTDMSDQSVSLQIVILLWFFQFLYNQVHHQ